jgi:hypothetical protein
VLTPPQSIRGELNAAVISGIRERGSDAVGLLIMGVARLIVGVITLGVVLGVAAIFGYDMTAVHLTGATAVAGLVGWWSGEASISASRKR